MYMEECCSVKKTSDGKFVLMVTPESKGKEKGKSNMAVAMPEPKSYVANDIEELKDLISEHVGGKKNSSHEKSEKEYAKGFKSK